MSAVCPTGDLWFYHNNAIMVLIIRPSILVVSLISNQLFFLKKNINSCLNACILCETSQQNTTQKTYICAYQDILLLIIENIHNLSFLFSGKIMSLQD